MGLICDCCKLPVVPFGGEDLCECGEMEDCCTCDPYGDEDDEFQEE